MTKNKKKRKTVKISGHNFTYNDPEMFICINCGMVTIPHTDFHSLDWCKGKGE